jgi:Fuc2NAc and GlcNAc transferase
MRAALAATVAFLFALSLSDRLRAWAAAHAFVDRPTERGLSDRPVPLLGGVAIALGGWGVALAAIALGGEVPSPMVALAVCSLALGGLGLVDDRRPLPVAPRLIAQVLVAAVFVRWVGAPETITLARGVSIHLSAAVALPLGVVWLVAATNLYNFMDGLDGLAGTQGFAAGVALALALAARGQTDLALVAACFGGASAGFLRFNLPPARIFLGDAGAHLLGFVFAGLTLVGARGVESLPVMVVPLALAPFLLDGTFTLVRRAILGERVWTPHATHLYQRAERALASRGDASHRSVLIIYAAWILMSGVAAVVAASSDATVILALMATLVVTLLGVWRWVARLEAKVASASRAIPAEASRPSSV